MRPFRSFLLLLIFLAFLTGLHYVIPVNGLFPSLVDFIPADLVNTLARREKTPVTKTFEASADTLTASVSDTISSAADNYNALNKISNGPVGTFLDSLRNSKGQVRVMYYGDSQIEGDRITSYLRRTLRKGCGGTGPGLLLPLMPVMYTKSVWLKSSSNWKKYN